MENSSNLQTSSLGIEIKELETSTVRTQLRKIKDLNQALKDSELETQALRREIWSLKCYKEQTANLKHQLLLSQQKNDWYRSDLDDRQRHELDFTMHTRKLSEMVEIQKENRRHSEEIEDLKNQLRERTKWYEYEQSLAQIEKQNLDGQITHLNDITAQQLTQLQKLARTAKDAKSSELQISELERQNEYLKEQLTQSNFEMKAQQKKMGMLSKWKQEIKDSGDLMRKASSEVESERAMVAKLRQESLSLSDQIEDLVQKNDEKETYIEELNIQLGQQKQNYDSIMSCQNELKQKFSKSNSKISETIQILGYYFAELTEWLEDEDCGEQPEQPPLPSQFIHLAANLDELVSQLYNWKTNTNTVQSLEITLEKLSADESNQKKQTREKLEQLNSHVETQESLYRDLLAQRDDREEDFRRLSKTHNQVVEKHNLYKEVSDKMEQQLNNVKQALIDAGYYQQESLENNVANVLDKLKAGSLGYEQKLAVLQAQNDTQQQQLEIEQEKFEKASLEYYNRINQMNLQIEKLNSAVDINSENAKEILEKCLAYEGQIVQLQNDLQNKDTGNQRIVDVLARGIVPLMQTATDLLYQKNILWSEYERMSGEIMQYRSLVSENIRRPIKKLRAAVIAIIAAHRFTRFAVTIRASTRSLVSFNGIFPKILRDLPEDFRIDENSNDTKIFLSIFQQREFFLSQPDGRLISILKPLHCQEATTVSKRVRQLSQTWETAREKCDMLQNSLDEHIEQKILILQDLATQKQKAKTIKAQLSGTIPQDQYDLLRNQLRVKETEIADLTDANEQAQQSLIDLHSASTRLQEHVNELLIQQTDYVKELDTKTKQIETLEENVRRSSNRVKSEEQARIVSDSMIETIQDKLGSMREELKSSTELVQSLSSDLSDSKSRIESMTETLNQLKADIKVKDIEIEILKNRRNP